ncbi:hypothetical protein F4677DRAFT_461945 [Hypoxylon crocopeplum]|nr:hypothetical protein F4677DRAFT_461945 [Hypoxylon crocopeplum]
MASTSPPPPPPPTASGTTTTINSPSDLSYSSGASRTSTRNTSPVSNTAISSPRPRSPLLSLNLSTVDIEHTPNTLLDQQPKMDRNPFQSVNDRRNKLTTDRSNSNQTQQPPQQSPQQAPFQQQTLRPGLQQLSLAPRGLTSSNWRAQAVIDEMANPTRSIDYVQLEPPLGNPMQQGLNLRHSPYTSPRMEQFPQQQQQLQYPGVASYPSASTLSDMQLDVSYGYCYDRGNGQYTRLIPADMLPPLKDIPALQQSCSGMMVLPLPRALPPNGRSSNTEPVALRNPSNSPTSPSDTIQSRIDTIVASSPPTPPAHHHAAAHAPMPTGVTGLGPGSSAGASAPVGAGHHGHGSHGVQQNQQQQQSQRRPKIYCDKWVHEGVCAFTQQGCKYKHEMPFDKVTQHQLGLFHGFPAWWKKHQADLSRQRDVPIGGGSGSGEEPARLSGGDRFLGRGGGGHGPSGSGGGGGGGGDSGGMGPSTAAWRRGGENLSSEQKSLGSSRGMRGVATGMRNPIASYGSPFGPIAPPGRNYAAAPGGPSFKMEDPGSPFQSPSCQAQLQQMGGPGGGGGGRTGATVPTANPYSSLESLEESGNGSGNGTGNGEEDGSASATNSNGARLN